jgi:hypothetical protein
MTYDNTNRGTIATNTRKSKDTDADITGSINIDGKEFWLNGWKKTNSRDSSTFYSLSVKPKEARREERQSAPPADFSDLDF